MKPIEYCLKYISLLTSYGKLIKKQLTKDVACYPCQNTVSLIKVDVANLGKKLRLIANLLQYNMPLKIFFLDLETIGTPLFPCRGRAVVEL